MLADGIEQVHFGGPVQPSAIVVLADFVEPDRAGVARPRLGRVPPLGGRSRGARRAAPCTHLRRLCRLGAGSARRRARGGLLDRRACAGGRRLHRRARRAVERRPPPQGRAVRRPRADAARSLAQLTVAVVASSRPSRGPPSCAPPTAPAAKGGRPLRHAARSSPLRRRRDARRVRARAAATERRRVSHANTTLLGEAIPDAAGAAATVRSTKRSSTGWLRRGCGPTSPSSSRTSGCRSTARRLTRTSSGSSPTRAVSASSCGSTWSSRASSMPRSRSTSA